MQLVNTN